MNTALRCVKERHHAHRKHIASKYKQRNFASLALSDIQTRVAHPEYILSGVLLSHSQSVTDGEAQTRLLNYSRST